LGPHAVNVALLVTNIILGVFSIHYVCFLIHFRYHDDNVLFQLLLLAGDFELSIFSLVDFCCLLLCSIMPHQIAVSKNNH
jgi:hypothetical protein